MLREAYGYGVKKVMLAKGRTNMTWGIDNLSASVINRYGENPMEPGTLWLFCGRNKSRIKGLMYEDGTGYILFNKALTEGTFQWPDLPKGHAPECMELDEFHLKLLLDGYTIEPTIHRQEQN